MVRPSTPPQQPQAATAPARSPPTPEVTRRIEESRLRSKALRDQTEASRRAAAGGAALPSQPRTSSGLVATADIQLAGPAGRKKRPYSELAASVRQAPSTVRDARSPAKPAGGEEAPLRPAKNFAKFVDYNFSAMTDTKGGFLSTEDDPFNKSMSAPAAKPGSQGPQEQKPAHMTADEWERMQTIKKLKRQKAGPYEPGLSVLTDERERKKCRECGSIEIDWVWEEVFHVCVCGMCKEKYPEKYSLLTKTEAKEDYLLTEPELKDPDLLPHLSRPNPHKSHWHDMMLFLRFQVEEHAFGKKWGSEAALDAEFKRREEEKKKRKEAKFREKLLDLKKKTRTDKWIKDKGGSTQGRSDKHVHDWGRAVENEDGMTVKTCLECGMEVEEMEF